MKRIDVAEMAASIDSFAPARVAFRASSWGFASSRQRPGEAS
jgi:hypothetical protein